MFSSAFSRPSNYTEVLEFVPGDREYCLVDSFRTEFLLTYPTSQSENFVCDDRDRLTGAFRAYVAKRVTEEDMQALDIDPNLWINVLLEQ